MPKVPTADVGNVGIATGGNAGFQQANVSFRTGADDLAVIGQQVANTAVRAGQMYEQIQRENRDTRVTSVMIEAEQEARQEMFKIYNQQGYDATKALDQSITMSDQLRKKYGSQFKTPEEKALFEKRMGAVLGSHQDGALRFSLQKTKEFRQQTAKSVFENAKASGVADRANPRAVALHEKRILEQVGEMVTGKKGAQTVNENGEIVEVPPRYTKEEKELINSASKELVHEYHNEIYEALSADSPTAALGYLKENRDKFSPTKYDDLLKTAREASENEIIMKQVDKQSLATNDVEKAISVAMKEARGLRPEAKQKLRDTMLRRFNQDEDIKQLKSRRSFEKEFDVMVQNPAAYDPLKMGLHLESGQQQKLTAWKDRWHNENVKKIKSHGNMVAYNKIMSLPYNQFKNIDLYDKKYVGMFSESDHKQLINYQQSGRPKYHAQATSMAKMKIDAVLSKTQGPNNDFNKTRENDFYTIYWQRLGQLDATQVNNETINSILVDMFEPIEIDTFGPFNKQVFKFERETAHAREAAREEALDDVPTKLIKAIGQENVRRLDYDPREDMLILRTIEGVNYYNRHTGKLEKKKKLKTKSEN